MVVIGEEKIFYFLRLFRVAWPEVLKLHYQTPSPCFPLVAPGKLTAKPIILTIGNMHEAKKKNKINTHSLYKTAKITRIINAGKCLPPNGTLKEGIVVNDNVERYYNNFLTKCVYLFFH